MNDAVASLALLLSPGTGNAGVVLGQSAARAVDRPLGALVGLPARDLVALLPPGMARVAETLARCGQPHQARAARLIERLVQRGGQAITLHEKAYPAALRASLGRDAPALLTVLGDPALLVDAGGAVVGARKATRRGIKLARACAQEFCRAGIAVVSGGARGVDSAAHAAALAAGGKTVVVLPQGLLTYVPPKAVKAAVAQGRAILVSQFVPDAPWETHAAVTRNATISGIARVVCVIEPKKVGGSIRTARAALAQGKRVAAYCPEGLPGSAAGPLAQTPALELLDAAGHFSADRLLDIWASTPALPAGQADLLEHAAPLPAP